MRAKKKSLKRLRSSAIFLGGGLLVVGMGTLGFCEPTSPVLSKIKNLTLKIAQPYAENMLQLKRVSVTGNEKVPAERILTEAGLASAPWAWEVNFSSITSRIEADPWIEKAEASWQFSPLRLTINVAEAEPWLVVDCGEVSWLLSKNKEIIGSLSKLEGQDFSDLADLPRLRGVSYDGELNSSNTQLSYALELVSLLTNAGGPGFKVASYELLDQGIRVEPDDPSAGPAISFLARTEQEAGDKLQQIRKINADLATRNERATEIDLRFNGQVIVR